MKRLLWKVDTQARENRNKFESSEQTLHRLLLFFIAMFALLNFLKVNSQELVYLHTQILFPKYLKLNWHLVLKSMCWIGRNILNIQLASANTMQMKRQELNSLCG